MELENFKTEDYLKIFEKVLDRINRLCEQGDSGNKNKNGLCRLIHDIISTLYPGTADTNLIQSECLSIITEAAGHEFSFMEYYWYNDRFGAVSEKDWYKPRIKCVKEVIKYLKNKKQ